MGKTHQVIYIPGLGDHRPQLQIRLLSKWNKPDFKVHFFQLGWIDDETFASKLARLTKLIDELYEQNGNVSIVGVSAGAGMAINGYLQRPSKISGLVFICGKIIGFNSVNPNYFINNPAFSDSLKLTQENLTKLKTQDKAKMLSLRPIFDDVVPISAMQVPGVQNRRIISMLHAPSIFLAITVYKKYTINFLKQRAGIQ